MRVLTIRHDKSINNVLFEQSLETYNTLRSSDPDLTDQGELNCTKIGRFLKENDFLIDKFYSSGHLRALKTMSYIANEYNADIPQEYLPDIYERGGIFLEGKGLPGMTKADMEKLFPKVVIPESIEISEGWYARDHKETDEEFRERVKRSLGVIREMASKIEVKEDFNEHLYTICLITHNTFLNAFYSLLCSSDYMIDNHSFSHGNLGISSFTISQKKEISIEFINFMR